MAKEKGISTLWGIVIIVVIAIILFGGVFAWQYFTAKSQPGVQSPQNQNQTAVWKTYTNTQYGFSFNYPSDWILHSNSNGASVLTKQHEVHNIGSLNGSTIDFSVSACNLSDKGCSDFKNDLDMQINANSNGGKNDLTFTIDGVTGSQWVIGADQYAYNGVLVRNGVLYDFGSTPEEYTMKYPNIADKQVKAIFDSFKFITPADQTAGWKTYTNTQYGYQIEYPKNAVVKSSDLSNVSISVPLKDGSIYVNINFPCSDMCGAYGPGVLDKHTSEDVSLGGKNFKASVWISDGILYANRFGDKSSYYNENIYLPLDNKNAILYGFNFNTVTDRNDIKNADSLVKQILSTFKFTN